MSGKMQIVVREDLNAIFWREPSENSWQNADLDKVISCYEKHENDYEIETSREFTSYYYDKTEYFSLAPTGEITRKIFRCYKCKQRINGNEIDISKMRYCPYCGRKIRGFEE